MNQTFTFEMWVMKVRLVLLESWWWREKHAIIAAGCWVYVLCWMQDNQERPYIHESTASRPICEVKHVLVELVLRWGTTLESLMMFFLPLGKKFQQPSSLDSWIPSLLPSSAKSNYNSTGEGCKTIMLQHIWLSMCVVFEFFQLKYHFFPMLHKNCN